MSKSAVIELKESVIPNITNDWEAYVDYDDDRVVYGIWASDELIEYADQARHLLGFMPCFNNFGNGVDDDGYYDFYIVADINGIREFYFVASVSDEDDWTEYDIPMSDSFKAKLFDRLNQISAERCGGTVRELIEMNKEE